MANIQKRISFAAQPPVAYKSDFWTQHLEKVALVTLRSTPKHRIDFKETDPALRAERYISQSLGVHCAYAKFGSGEAALIGLSMIFSCMEAYPPKDPTYDAKAAYVEVAKLLAANFDKCDELKARKRAFRRAALKTARNYSLAP